MHYSHKLLPLSLTLLLAACSSQPEQLPPPPEPIQPEKPQVIEIPQATGAIPRPEPLSASGNRDNWIGKQKNEVWRDIKHYSEEGTASWLAQDLDGQKTANGDVQDSKLFSAAHRNLPLPSYVRVTNLDNGLETIVRVNDRGPFGSDRLIDLSHAAAKQLEMVEGGEARVRVELINDTPDQMVIMAPHEAHRDDADHAGGRGPRCSGWLHRPAHRTGHGHTGCRRTRPPSRLRSPNRQRPRRQRPPAAARAR